VTVQTDAWAFLHCNSGRFQLPRSLPLRASSLTTQFNLGFNNANPMSFLDASYGHILYTVSLSNCVNVGSSDWIQWCSQVHLVRVRVQGARVRVLFSVKYSSRTRVLPVHHWLNLRCVMCNSIWQAVMASSKEHYENCERWYEPVSIYVQSSYLFHRLRNQANSSWPNKAATVQT